jgi:hypothetical protein
MYSFPRSKCKEQFPVGVYGTRCMSPYIRIAPETKNGNPVA